jgi:hypothetical protein
MNIDSSTLSRYTTCPQEYYYYKVLKREATGWRAGIEFGSIIHQCLDIRYRGLGDIRDLQRKTLEKFYATARFEPGDYRDLNYAIGLLERYDATYPIEPFDVLPPTEQHIEVAFSVPLPTLLGYKWTGRVDLVVRYPDNRIWTLDHKTSSIGGASFFDEYLNSQAQVGYVWAMEQVTGQPIAGFIVNAIFNRKITRTGDGITFERQLFHVTQEQKEEWLENTTNVIRQIERDEHFCQHKSQCARKYGKCEYLDVCSMPRNARERILASNMYQDVTWDPLKVV